MKKDELFRGYIKIDGKTPVQKFKEGSDLLSLDEASKLKEYGGVLAEDTVCIDVDDKEQAEKLFDIVEGEEILCRVLRTSRGCHFYFKNCGALKITKCWTGVKLVCGIEADIKVGLKNSYAKLKSNGVEREIEYDILEGESYQNVPVWLLPVEKGLDLLNLSEGDGRNQTLFDYILKLNSMGFSKEMTRESLRIINKYIFKNPLPQSELETLSRDEAFPEAIFIDPKKGFLHDKFGNYIINECHICRINGELHIYENGVYVNGEDKIEKSMIKYIPNLRSNQRTECLKYIGLMAKEIKNASDPKYIAFNNGILDIETMKLLPFSPEFIITNRIPHNWNPDAYDETCHNMMNKVSCYDAEIRMLLEEMVGACFYRSNNLAGGKTFVLTGEKANGKSTFLEMVNTVLGLDNVSSLDLSELDERFSIAELSGKLANIGDDISDEFLFGRAVAIFKKLTTGNRVKGERKGEDAFFFTPYSKLLFSANNIPRTKDKTGAVLRRLVIIPFNATFKKTDPDYDPFIGSKLKSEQSMEYLIRCAIEGLLRVIETNGFTEPKKVTEALVEYEHENNPFLSFIEEVGKDSVVNQLTDDVFRRYRTYCVENGFTELTKINFSKQLSRNLGVVTKLVKVDGKVMRMYVTGGNR